MMFAGATIPLPRTEEERAASGDSRPCITSLYSSRAVYMDRIRAAAEALAAEGRILEEDVEFCTDRAEKLYTHFAEPAATARL